MSDPQNIDAGRIMRSQVAPNSPLHIREGGASAWRQWFAWRPVELAQGGRAWLRTTWRRRTYPASWFCPQVGNTSYLEFSDERRGFWERPPPQRTPR